MREHIVAENDTGGESLLSEEETFEGEIVSRASDAEYKVYPYRWISLAALSLSLFANGAAYSFYSPVGPSLEMVNMTFYPYMILYPLSSFLIANYVFSKLGTAAALFLGGGMIIIGVWMRTMINYSFSMVVLGSIFLSIAQPLLYNAPAVNSAIWFSPAQRPIATTIGSLASPIGTATGFVFPVLFIYGEEYYKEPENVLSGHKHVYNASIFEALLFTSLILCALILFKEKPLTPPSASAGNPPATVSLREGFKKLIKNKEFMLISGQYWVIILVMNTVTVGVAAMIIPFGFVKPMEASLIGIAFTVVGLVGAFVGAIFVAKTKKFKLAIIIISTGGTVSFLCLALSLWLHAYYLTLILGGLLGFFLLPAMSITVEYVCEVSYPIDEATAAGFCIAIGQLVSVFATIIGSVVLDPKTTSKTIVTIFGIIFSGVISMGILLSSLAKQKLRRLEHDAKQFVMDEGKEEREFDVPDSIPHYVNKDNAEPNVL